mgnify:FL=1
MTDEEKAIAALSFSVGFFAGIGLSILAIVVTMAFL